MIDMFELAGADPQPGMNVNCGHRRQGNEINNFSPEVPRQINKNCELSSFAERDDNCMQKHINHLLYQSDSNKMTFHSLMKKNHDKVYIKPKIKPNEDRKIKTFY